MTGFVAQTSSPFGTETHLSMEAPAARSASDALAAMLQDYAALLREHDLSGDGEILLRFHLSDVANQAGVLRSLLAGREGTSFRSWVGQAPASGSKCALEAYHIESATPIAKTLDVGGALLVEHGSYRSLWKRCLPGDGRRTRSSRTVEAQTNEVFQELSRTLEAKGIGVRQGLLRTWIYLRDIDRSYEPFVEARRAFFSSAAQVPRGRFPASTGIEGESADPSQLLCMDSLAVAGLAPEQIRPMEALDHLCHPGEYQVTFERGVQVTYGDRTQYYISGTASIDKDGNVLHAGDVARQAGRTLQNIEALLSACGASLGDLTSLVVYLRDPADHPAVASFLRDSLPGGLPRIVVMGKVCRPGWLIEMDGIAISSKGDERYAPYC